MWRPNSFKHLMRKASDTLAWTAGLGLLAMVLVTVVDVVGRYLFNKPLPTGHALVQALVFGVVFVGLPLLSAQRGYMRVELLDSALTAPLTRTRNRLIDLLVAVFLLIIGLQFLWHGGYYGRQGEYIELLEIPLAVFAVVGGTLCLIAALLTALRLIEATTPDSNQRREKAG